MSHNPSKARFWQKRCQSVLGGEGKYPDINCDLRLDHSGDHHSAFRELYGHATYRWDTAEDTAHKEGN